MQQLNQEGRRAVADIASRYQLSLDAVEHMLNAVNNGAGSMAQFNCRELGGSGQWMRGGMTMVGDMFNQSLKSTVDRLCNDLSHLLASTRVYASTAPSSPGHSQWWPAELGMPRSSGSQNSSRYAVFAERLAIEADGEVSVYDTLDHQITGVGQQQGDGSSLTFSSQYGTVSITSLPLVSGEKSAPVSVPSPSMASSDSAPTLVEEAPVAVLAGDGSSEEPSSPVPDVEKGRVESGSDLLTLIEKLAQLHGAGVLTDEEFSAKKMELLARL